MSSVSCTVACNLCGATTAEQIGTSDREGRPLQTVLCRECGLVWTDPRPGTEQNRKFYAEDYRLQYKSTFVPKKKHVYRETLRAINRFVEIEPLLRPGIKMLDVGSGAGFFPYVARSQGVEACGIEPNRGFATYAVDTFEVPTTNAFFQDVELPAESFDFITLNHVLEHVEDPCATLTQLRTWLRPNGYLVVEVPNVEATYHSPGNRFHIGHLYNFNPINLAHLGVKAGLTVHESKLVTRGNHIHIIFKKSPLQISDAVNYAIPNNFHRVSSILQRHTAMRHYSSPVPYVRFLRKQAQYLVERRAVSNANSPRVIADTLIQSHLGTPTRQAA